MADLLRNYLLTALRPSRYQARSTFDAAGLLELAGSIRAHGLLNPLIVFSDEQGEPELIAGERRTRAMLCLAAVEAKGLPDLASAADFFATHGLEALREEPHQVLAGAIARAGHTAQCHVLFDVTPEHLHEIALVDNLQRSDLSALDEARALKAMIDQHGYSQRQLADRIGKSQTYISQRLVLLELAPEVSQRVVAGELDPAAAREIARLDQSVQVSMADFAKALPRPVPARGALGLWEWQAPEELLQP